LACQTVHLFIYRSIFFFIIMSRYDPLADVPNDIEGEQDRVMFIRTITQIIVKLIDHFLSRFDLSFFFFLIQ